MPTNKRISNLPTALLCATLSLFGCGQNANRSSPPAAATQASDSTLAEKAASPDAHRQKQRIRAGTGAAAIAKASVGYYMDVQAAKLRDKLASSGGMVSREGDFVIITLPGSRVFVSDGYGLSPQAPALLSLVASVINEHKSTLVQIIAYNEMRDSVERSQRMTAQRGQATARMMENNGVHPERIRVAAGNGMAASLGERIEIRLDPIIE